MPPDYQGHGVSLDQQIRQAPGRRMTPKVLWQVAKETTIGAGSEKLEPHDLRN